MLSKIALGAAAAATALVAIPTAASAQPRGRGYYGHHDGRYYGRGYRQYPRYRGYYPRTTVVVAPGYYGGYGYDPYYYGGYAYPAYPAYYGGRRYYRDDYCGDGVTGAVIGGGAGALIGREIGRDGNRYRRYGNRHSGTTGALIGGAIGALVGSSIERSDCY